MSVLLDYAYTSIVDYNSVIVTLPKIINTIYYYAII